MKKPHYKGGGRIKGEPEKPVKSTVDRTKYSSQLSKPIEGTGTNFVGDTPESLNPAVLEANGYKYHSGTMGGKDIIYEKNGNLHVYNEQPNAVQNKYGLINIGNPNATVTNTTVSTPGLASVTKPAIDPNHKPLDLSNPNMVYDPNTKTYTSTTTGTKINPIVETYPKQTLKKGGEIKGYGVGTTDLPTTNDYAAARDKAIQDKAKADEAKKQASQKKAGEISSALGGAALTIGNQMYTDPQDLTSNPDTVAKTQQLNSGIDNTAASVTPWYGLAKGLSNIGRSLLKKDKYGNVIGGTNQAADEWMKPQHQSMIDSYKREGAGGVAKEILTGSSNWRAVADLAGKGNETTGMWGKLNKFTGNTAIKQKTAENIAASIAADPETLAQQEELKRQNLLNQGKMQNAITLRDYGAQGYKDGGPIKGPGTGKSDSVNAKIKPHSFIVPEENSETAEVIRKVVLKAPSTKANLDQSKGTEVKVSNGEHIFTPEEKGKIKKAGINIDALAPNAEDSQAMKGGGDVNKKEDGKTKQRKFYLEEKIRNKTITPAEVKEYGKLNELPAKKTYKSAPKTTVPVTTNANGLTKWDLMNPQMSPSFNNDVVEGDRPLVVPKDNLTNNGATITPTENSDFTYSYNPTNKTTPSSDDPIDNRPGFKFDLGKALNYGIPLVQTGLGLKALKDAGKRPVDQLDPDYIDSINKAKNNLTIAQQNARYGFTPEEAAMLKNRNANLTAGQRFDARALSGGSSSSALNNERVALNDAYDRDLQTAATNRALQLQKQDIAYGRQNYVDDLTGVQKEAKRRLFVDKMNGWQQNQLSGQQLLGAGLQNIVGAKRYQDELAAEEKRSQLYNTSLI